MGGPRRVRLREHRRGAERLPRESRLEREESGRTRLDRERARRQAGCRTWDVERARRHVVRRVRMEERRQVLDVAAAYAELELAASVCADAALLAVVVRREEARDGAEA